MQTRMRSIVFEEISVLIGSVGSFSLFATIFVVVVILASFLSSRGSRKPVEWPNAKIGVGQIKSFSVSPKPDKKDYYEVTMQMAVEAQDGTTFDSVLTRKLPAHKHSLLEQGMLVPVMYRPGRTEKVKIARGQHEQKAQDFLNQVKIRDGILDRETLEADLRGRPARSQVTSIKDTGRKVRGLKEYELGLSVFPKRGEPYEVSKRMILTNSEAKAAAPGAILPTRYLPHQPNALVVSLRPKNVKADAQ